MAKEAREDAPGGTNRLVEMPFGKHLSKVCLIVGKNIQFDARERNDELIYVTKGG